MKRVFITWGYKFIAEITDHVYNFKKIRPELSIEEIATLYRGDCEADRFWIREDLVAFADELEAWRKQGKKNV